MNTRLPVTFGLAAIAVGLTMATMSACDSVTCEDNLTCQKTGEGGADAPQGDGQGPDARDSGKDSHHDGAKDGPASEGGDASDGSSPCPKTATPHDNPCVLQDSYGVFVAPVANGGSDTSGNGTRAKPFRTIGHALANLMGTDRVYACAATYAESVVISPGGVSVFGGLQCPMAVDGGVVDAGTVDSSMGPWSYNGVAAAVAPTATGYALDVESVSTGAHFEDMTFTALAANPVNPGESSIGVMVNNSTNVAFVRVGATAANGADGATGGALASNHCASSLDGSSTITFSGGAGGACTDTATAGNCPVFGMSLGGGGGPAGLSAGSMGSAGGSIPVTTLSFPGADGIGGPGAVVSPFATCGNGHNGANGSAEAGGAKGGAGSLASTGWQPATAPSGSAGDPGQGGGGGGGQAGSGVFGGAGGAGGGCGGNGGAGGEGGGASIALAIVKSTVTLTGVTLQSGVGGQGGAGAQGEQGQAGGAAGAASGECNGGVGGQGAGGSGGGGGAGGPSVGIGVANGSNVKIDGTKVTPPLTTLSSPSSYVAGSGGSPGSGGTPGAVAPGGGGNPGEAGNSGTDGPAGAMGAVGTL